MLSKSALLQNALDGAYDVYAFGREGDIQKGLAAGGVGMPMGLFGSQLGHALPQKYKFAGEILGGFLGSMAGAEVGLRTLDGFRTARNYQPTANASGISKELQDSPVLTQIVNRNYA
jgi:hypothetical protein